MTVRLPAALLVLLVPPVLVAATSGAPTADAALFAAAGERLLSASAGQVLADPSLQVGPLHLLLTGVGSRLAGPVGVAPTTGAALVPAWVVLGLLVAVERWSGPRAPGARLGLLAQVGLGGALTLALLAGHLEELLAALLLAAAGTALHRGHPGLAGAACAAAACTKLWALIVLGALLCAPDVRERRRALAVSCGVVAAVHAPFLPAARTHELAWSVDLPSLVALVLPVGTGVTAVGRLLQLAAAVALVWCLLRRSAWDARLVWTVPAAVVLARVTTDPHVLPYYWAAAAVPLALATWSPHRSPARAALAAAAGTPALLLLTSVGGRTGTALLALTAVAAWCALHRAARRPAPSQRPAVVQALD